MGRGAVPAHARSGEIAGGVRRHARTAGNGLCGDRDDPLRGRRGRPARGARRPDHAPGATAQVGRAHPPHRPEQPQPRGRAHGGPDGAHRRADVLGEPLLRPAAAERRRGYALGGRELRAGAAQHRPRTATALRILRTRRDRHRRDEGLRRRRPAERRQLALRTPDDPGTMPRIRPDAPRRSGRNGRLPQPRRDRSGTGLVFGHGRGTRLHGGAGRAGQILVGRALHVLRALRPVFGGDRHRRCEQILQPDPGTARDTGDGARTLQAPAAPRLGVHRLRPLRTELPVRRRHHRPHAAGGGEVRILSPQARNGDAVRTRRTRNRHAFHGVPFLCGGSATISYLCNPTRPE